MRWALGLSYLPLVFMAPALPVVGSFWPELTSVMSPFFIAGVCLLSLSAAAALVLLARKAVEKSSVVLASGILLTTALLGFSMPKANAYLGYGEVAHEVSLLRASHPHHPVVAVGMKRAANMDVYLKENVRLLSDSCLNELPDSAIVVMKQSDAVRIRWQAARRVGEYVVGTTTKIR